MLAEFLGEDELVGAEAFNLFEVVVPGIRAGEFEAVGCLNREVEFHREFEVDEFAGLAIAQEEVEFAEGFVNAVLKLQVLFKELVAVRG